MKTALEIDFLRRISSPLPFSCAMKNISCSQCHTSTTFNFFTFSANHKRNSLYSRVDRCCGKKYSLLRRFFPLSTIFSDFVVDAVAKWRMKKTSKYGDSSATLPFSIDRVTDTSENTFVSPFTNIQFVRRMTMAKKLSSFVHIVVLFARQFERRAKLNETKRR